MQTNGTIFTQIAPLYYSPYGSHLREYIDDPWAHLSLTDSTLKRLVLEKPLGKTDQIRAKWMHDQYMQLNKITAMELENLFIEAGFKFDTKKIFETSITPHKNLLEIFNKKTLTTYELIYVVKKLI